MLRFWILTLIFGTLFVSRSLATTPTVSSTNPTEGETIPVRNKQVEITFDQAVRNIDDSDIDNNSIDNLISVFENGQEINGGFDATISNSNNKITITFDDLLTASADYSIKVAPVENSGNEASAEFTLNFSTGAHASIDNITLSNKLCAGGTANLNTIVIREGFIGNFFNPTGEGTHQNIRLELPDNLIFDVTNASITVNNGNTSDVVTSTFELQDKGSKKVLFIGFAPTVTGATVIDVIRLSGVAVQAGVNVSAGDYNIILEDVDSSYPGLEVNDIVGSVTVRSEESVVLSNNITGSSTSLTICAGEEVIFTPTSGTGPFDFYKDGQASALGSGTSFTTTALQDGDIIYAVSTGNTNFCAGTSTGVAATVTDNSAPVITLTNLEDNSTSTIEEGQTFAIPATEVGVGLSANQSGEFNGADVNNDEFLISSIDREPGFYNIMFHNTEQCKPDVSFVIEVFDNSRNQLLGVKNNGICFDAVGSIPVGWIGEGVEGELMNITSTPDVVTGSLNSNYNGGLSSGFLIDTDQVRALSQVGEEIVFTITYEDLNNETATVEQVIDVEGTPQLEIVLAGELPLEESYCENASSIKLVGNPLGTGEVKKTFSILDLNQPAPDINSAVILNDLTFFFNPAEAPGGTAPENILTHNDNKGYVILYEYLNEFGCAAAMTDTIFVVPLPDSLSVDPLRFDFCMGDEIGYTKIDKPDTVDVAWYNSQGFLLAVEDSLDLGINTSFPDIFDFSVRPRNKDIGCLGPPTSVILRVGEFPKAAFTFFSNCTSDGNVTFNSLPSLGGSALRDSIQNRYWNFNDPDAYVKIEDKQTTHEFPAGGVFEVSLVVETALGCSDSVTQSVSVFEVMDGAVQNNTYLETFNLGAGGWISTRENNNANGYATNSSWKITERDGYTGWATANDTTGVFNDDEDSWVESPCFNLDLWDKPKIDMDIRYYTDKFEGTTLQYSISESAVTDEEIKWETLGEIDGGIEWFNSAGIAAAPGGQTIGWEGGTDQWKKARVSLDKVKEEANGRPVRFRMAFSSLALGDSRDDKFDGFAFDNFSIRERNRMIVLEHFTNINAVGNATENAYVNSFADARLKEAIKIEYHTSYPASDPLYEDNKADQSAHSLEYGISNAPRTVMDGIYGVHYRNDPFSTDEWGKNMYAKRTIIDAPFNLAISDTLIAGGDSQGRKQEGLKIDVTITKNLTADTIFAPLVLEIGILQKTVEVNGQIYHNVLRKLLPDAKGTYVNGDWMPNDLSRTETVTEYWNPTVEYNPSDTFLIVAYIHDTHLTKTKSKEIYQGAYKKVSVVPPKARVTGLDKINAVGVNLFPNPAKGDVNLVLDQPLMQSSEIKVYSPNGVVVYNAVMDKGTKTFRIPLENYPNGLYIVSFYAQGQMVKRQLVLR